MSNSLRVGACQTPEIIGDIGAALACVEGFARRAGSRADILLFPECFLQGYMVTPKHVSRNAISLDSEQFRSILGRLSSIPPTVVFGLIEQAGESFFNTAVVIQRGKLLGKYRKTHLLDGEKIFIPGAEYPVFTQHGVTFGINICYDAQFPEAAQAVAEQGAQLLLLPAQNMLRLESAKKWKDLHNEVRAKRVKETGMWLVSADVTGKRGNTHIGYGPTCALNSQAQVVAQVPLLQTGMIIASVTTTEP
ncbi:MAG TPA: carbon-nitrogen hydrolase family protein [Candidatus Saccharimonadales bacterium]|nr:carbon-nitrogen hydrolase family protein [Candidatus Saccharimonadales bacterium]